MATEEWEKLQRLFEEGLEYPASERDAWLSTACDGNQQLQLELRQMLQADAQADGFLDTPASVDVTLPPTLQSGACLGRYEILEMLGEGGMGEVYRAIDSRLGREVAIKVLPRRWADHADAVDRFHSEARAVAALNHRNILAIHDFGQDAGVNFAVTELLTGETLRKRLDSGPLPWKSAVEFSIQVARALQVAHDKEIVHRDIKPENLFLTDAGDIKILDYGLAQSSVGASRRELNSAELSAVTGTPAYMSPEQVTGVRVGPASDLFSLACVLYEMLEGAAPFRRESVKATVEAVVQEPSPASKNGPQALAKLLRHCFEKNPLDRPRSCSEFAAQLLQILNAEQSEQRLKVAAANRPDERRQITVMFCELEAARMTEWLDSEDMQLVLRAYHQMIGDVIADFGGYVAQHLGSGVLAYFGYPRAAEDDATRAVRASQKVLEKIPHLTKGLVAELPELAEVKASVRIGLDTGMVVVGAIGSSAKFENLAAGDPVLIAERLKDQSADGKVTVSRETASLIAGVFELRSCGWRELSGISRPIEAMTIEGEKRIQSRFSMVLARGLSQFVNREKLLELLRRCWSEATHRKGQALLLIGDAGIGKSRLAQFFRQKLSGQEHGWLECQCESMHAGDALFPVLTLLEQMLELSRSDGVEERRRRIADRMALAGIHDERSLKLIYALVGVAEADGLGPPELVRRATLTVLVEWTVALSRERPLVFLVEDLHWADPSTLEFLGLLLEKSKSEALLVLLTAREEFSPKWNGDVAPRVERMTPIGKTDLRKLINAVIDRDVAVETDIDALIERSDGIPMFAEELTRAWNRSVSQGESSLETIPATLRDTLTARIDSLGEERALLQLASILGRDFSSELLAELSSENSSDIERSLRSLVASGVIYESGPGLGSLYRFHHALLQDSAYHSLPKRQRRYLHQKAAEIFRGRHDEALAAIVAQHYEAAGQLSQAARFYLQAGRRENRRAAYFEAISHFQRARELIARHSKTDELIDLEINVLLDMTLPLAAIESVSSPKIEHCLQKVLELSKGLRGDTYKIQFQALFGLARHCGGAAKLKEGKRYCREFIGLAKRADNQVYELTATAMLAGMHQWSGEFKEADELSAKVISHSMVFEGQAMELKLDVHPVLYAYVAQMWVSWAYGDAQRLRRIQDEALSYARELGNAPAEGYVHAFIASTLYSIKDYQGVVDSARESIDFCSKRNLIHFLYLITGASGTSRVYLGDKEGLAATEQATASVVALGTGAAIPGYFAILADSQLLCGYPEKALSSVNRGIASSEETTAYYYYSVLLHLKAKIVGALDGPASAEVLSLLQKAYEIAIQQGCIVMAARVATDLSSLWLTRGDTVRAGALLETTCQLFNVEKPCLDLLEAESKRIQFV